MILLGQRAGDTQEIFNDDFCLRPTLKTWGLLWTKGKEAPTYLPEVDSEAIEPPLHLITPVYLPSWDYSFWEIKEKEGVMAEENRYGSLSQTMKLRGWRDRDGSLVSGEVCAWLFPRRRGLPIVIQKLIPFHMFWRPGREVREHPFWSKMHMRPLGISEFVHINQPSSSGLDVDSDRHRVVNDKNKEDPSRLFGHTPEQIFPWSSRSSKKIKRSLKIFWDIKWGLLDSKERQTFEKKWKSL